jgi:hypothetical protein
MRRERMTVEERLDALGLGLGAGVSVEDPPRAFVRGVGAIGRRRRAARVAVLVVVGCAVLGGVGWWAWEGLARGGGGGGGGDAVTR